MPKTSTQLGEAVAGLTLTADATPIAVPLTQLTTDFPNVPTYYLGVYVSGSYNVSVLPKATNPKHTANQVAAGGWDTFGPFKVSDGTKFLYATAGSLVQCTLNPVLGEAQ